MGEPPVAHRKTWEFAYIAEVLEAFGQLTPGRRALGFGVGREPLVSAFASRGVQVVATDLAPDSREALGWVGPTSTPRSRGPAPPRGMRPRPIPRAVSWRAVDMRAIPRT